MASRTADGADMGPVGSGTQPDARAQIAGLIFAMLHGDSAFLPIFCLSLLLGSLMLRTQHNAWIHLAATALVVALGFWLGIAPHDWRWIVLAIALTAAAIRQHRIDRHNRERAQSRKAVRNILRATGQIR